MSKHPDVAYTLCCGRCRDQPPEILQQCDFVQQLSQGRDKCTRCRDRGRSCSGSWPSHFNDFRRHCIKDIVDSTLVQHFTNEFNRYYKKNPILVYSAIAFAALKSAPRDAQDPTYNRAFKAYDSVIKLVPQTQIGEENWRPWFIAFQIFAPVSIHISHVTVGQGSFLAEISRRMLVLRVFYDRLGTYKDRLVSSATTGPLFKNAVQLPLVGDAELLSQRPVQRLHRLIDAQPANEFGPRTAEVKQELKDIVVALYRMHTNTIRIIDRNRTTPNPQNNHKSFFLWHSVIYRPCLWANDTNINVASTSDRQHPVWKAILCHWGLLCYIGREKWYLAGVGERMMNDQLDWMRENRMGDNHVYRDAMLHVASAMDISPKDANFREGRIAMPAGF